MARQRSEQPAYSSHSSEQARVRMGGKVYYLGKHGTPESYARYRGDLVSLTRVGLVPPA